MAGHKSCEIIRVSRLDGGHYSAALSDADAGRPVEPGTFPTLPPYGHERVRVERPDYEVRPVTTLCQTGIYHLQQWSDDLKGLSRISNRSNLDDRSRLK